MELERQEERGGGEITPSLENEEHTMLSQLLGSRENQTDTDEGEYILTSDSESEEEDHTNLHCRFESQTERAVIPHSDDEKEAVLLNSGSSTRKRKIRMTQDVNANLQVANSDVMNRAKEIQVNLDPKFPSFIKLMTRSNATKGFWLHIPSSFRKNANMPKDDETIILEDESGIKYKTKYIVRRGSLSGGWRGFAACNNILEGDVAVFHWVHNCKFKVSIVRASTSNEIRRTLIDSNLLSNAEERDYGTEAEEKSEGLYIGENDQNDRLPKKIVNDRNGRDESEKCENLGAAEFEGSFVDFQEFNNAVSSLIEDSKITEDMFAKYYELCLARNSYLHQGLPKSINHMLATGIIIETVNLADCIKGCKLSTSYNEFATWDKKLKALEAWGMDVGFLRSRLSYLVDISTKVRESPEIKKHAQAKLQQCHFEDEIQTLKIKLREVKQARSKLKIEVDGLEAEIQIREQMFEEKANSSWSLVI